MKIRVTATERPDNFCPKGRMDYILNRACELKVLSARYDGYFVPSTQSNTAVWFIRYEDCEVIQEYIFPSELRKGDSIDWNQIDPEVCLVELFTDVVPNLYKFVGGAWYVSTEEDNTWEKGTPTFPCTTPVTWESVYRGQRQAKTKAQSLKEMYDSGRISENEFNLLSK